MPQLLGGHLPRLRPDLRTQAAAARNVICWSCFVCFLFFPLVFFPLLFFPCFDLGEGQKQECRGPLLSNMVLFIPVFLCMLFVFGEMSPEVFWAVVLFN